jgi:hypothetical protein
MTKCWYADIPSRVFSQQDGVLGIVLDGRQTNTSKGIFQLFSVVLLEDFLSKMPPSPIWLSSALADNYSFDIKKKCHSDYIVRAPIDPN